MCSNSDFKEVWKHHSGLQNGRTNKLFLLTTNFLFYTHDQFDASEFNESYFHGSSEIFLAHVNFLHHIFTDIGKNLEVIIKEIGEIKTFLTCNYEHSACPLPPLRFECFECFKQFPVLFKKLTLGVLKEFRFQCFWCFRQFQATAIFALHSDNIFSGGLTPVYRNLTRIWYLRGLQKFVIEDLQWASKKIYLEAYMNIPK